jgi:hypothetical protein
MNRYVLAATLLPLTAGACLGPAEGGTVNPASGGASVTGGAVSAPSGGTNAVTAGGATTGGAGRGCRKPIRVAITRPRGRTDDEGHRLRAVQRTAPDPAVAAAVLQCFTARISIVVSRMVLVWVRDTSLMAISQRTDP